MIRIAGGDGALAAFADEWRQLEPTATSVFQRHDFATAWWRHFGAGREAIVLYAEHHSGRALLPLVQEENTDDRAGDRDLRVIGAGAFDVLDALTVGEPPLRAVAEELHGLRCRRLRVNATPREAPLARLVRMLPGEADERYFSATPILRTRGRDLTAFRHAHDRAAYRHRRLLQRRSGNVREIVDPAEAHHVLHTAFELKRRSLTPEQLQWMYPDERYEGFLAALVEHHLGGLLRFPILTIGGEFAACVIYFADRGTWNLYFTAFDHRFAAESPGAVLLWEIVERAIAGNVLLVNFLTGEQWYKLRWHDELWPLVTIDANSQVEKPANRCGMSLGN